MVSDTKTLAMRMPERTKLRGRQESGCGYMQASSKLSVATKFNVDAFIKTKMNEIKRLLYCV